MQLGTAYTSIISAYFHESWRWHDSSTITDVAAAIACAALLAGCGGSSSPLSAVVPPPEQPVPVPLPPEPAPPVPNRRRLPSPCRIPPPPVPAPDPVPPVEKPPSVFLTFWNLCAAPRTGLDASGHAFPDRQGTLADEMSFVRGWADEFYFWYGEIPANIDAASFSNPVDYFGQLKTPAITASGRAKDRYHFTYTTERWDAISGAGVDVGYGVTWSRNTGPNLPRTWIATLVEPGSPGDAAQLRRGDLLLEVDGIDFVNAADKPSVDAINAGLFPVKAGEAHRLTVSRGGARIVASFTSANVSISAVKNTKTIDTPTGKVGYLSFESHTKASEAQLIASVTQLKEAGITDLVLDVRYNGGGFLFIASELAYMIAGAGRRPTARCSSKADTTTRSARSRRLLFRSTAYGYCRARRRQPGPAPALSRPEAGHTAHHGRHLFGQRVDRQQLARRRCRSEPDRRPDLRQAVCFHAGAQLRHHLLLRSSSRASNAKGFGDYADGMAPTCSVPDDLSRAIGDPAEGMLAAALKYRASGSCPAGAAARAQVGAVATGAARGGGNRDPHPARRRP